MVRRVRRAILEDATSETRVGYADGSVVGWLPKEQSDFVSEFSDSPAALWHVKVCVCELACWAEDMGGCVHPGADGIMRTHILASTNARHHM